MKLNFEIKSTTAVCLLLAAMSCKKNENNGFVTPVNNYPSKTDSVYSPVDPSIAPTIGFFMNGWVARTFTPPDTVSGVVPITAATDSLLINANQVVTKVSPYVYGHNSIIWVGQMVDQPVLMQYIKDLAPNIIRAPAGSLSDQYFFNGTDAMKKPADAPDSILGTDGKPKKMDTRYGNNGNGDMLLSNYYKMLTQANSTGIITINYGYARYGTSANPVAAAAHLAADWVRYDNGRTKYWEIGNENYGNWEAGWLIDTTKNKDHQPQMLTGALYGTHLKQFSDSMKAAAKQLGSTIYIGAVLYPTATSSSDALTTQTWTQGVLANAGNYADYFIIHDYFTPYATNSGIPDILKTGNTVPPTDMAYIKQQMTAANVTPKPIAFTEWNIQATGSKQNVSNIAGMNSAKTLGSMIKSQFGEASRWDLANGYANGDDQGLFNNPYSSEPNSAPWNPRPAFYYMYYFQKYFGDRMVQDTLRSATNNTDIVTYSSSFSSGQVGTVLINSGSLNHVVSIDIQHFPAGSKYYWYVLTGGSDNAGFSSQVYVNGTGPTALTVPGGPLNYATIKPFSAPLKGTIKVAVPPMSVVYLVADKK